MKNPLGVEPDSKGRKAVLVRHSGESRNPEPIRIKMIRPFLFWLIVWEKAKSKDEKAKSLDSGMRRNDEQGENHSLASRFRNAESPNQGFSMLSGREESTESIVFLFTVLL